MDSQQIPSLQYTEMHVCLHGKCQVKITVKLSDIKFHELFSCYMRIDGWTIHFDRCSAGMQTCLKTIKIKLQYCTTIGTITT